MSQPPRSQSGRTDQSTQGSQAIQQAMQYPLEQAVAFQKGTARLFLNGLELTNWAQTRGVRLTRQLFTSYIQTLEETARETESMAQEGIETMQRAGQTGAQFGHEAAPWAQPGGGHQQPTGQAPVGHAQPPQAPTGHAQPHAPTGQTQPSRAPTGQTQPPQASMGQFAQGDAHRTGAQQPRQGPPPGAAQPTGTEPGQPPAGAPTGVASPPPNPPGQGPRATSEAGGQDQSGTESQRDAEPESAGPQ